MTVKILLAIMAAVVFAVPAAVAVSDGFMNGSWGPQAPLFLGLALLAAAEAYGAADHETRDEAEAHHRAS